MYSRIVAVHSSMRPEIDGLLHDVDAARLDLERSRMS